MRLKLVANVLAAIAAVLLFCSIFVYPDPSLKLTSYAVIAVAAWLKFRSSKKAE